MKTNHILTCLALLVQSCVSQRTISSKINTEGLDSRGNVMLVGASTKERLQQKPFAAWFNKNYSSYKVDSATASLLAPRLKTKRFVIFMGTWCGDSQQEVPRIYKILDFCGVPQNHIKLVNLSPYDSVYKQSPTHEEKGLNIHRVPDLLIYENKTEIGRIVERPIESLEKDLLAIIEGRPYRPRYAIVNYLDSLFRTTPIQGVEKDIVKIADSLKSIITKNEGLQSYGNVLLATKEIQKALIVLRLNTMLYPAGINGFVALGEAYFRTGDRAKAKEAFTEVLTLHPGHARATEMLAQLVE